MALAGLALVLPACSQSTTSGGPGGWSTLAALPAATTPPPPGGTNTVTAALGETSPTQMFIHLSSAAAVAGKVTFAVTNSGTRTHEFVVLPPGTSPS